DPYPDIGVPNRSILQNASAGIAHARKLSAAGEMKENHITEGRSAGHISFKTANGNFADADVALSLGPRRIFQVGNGKSRSAKPFLNQALGVVEVSGTRLPASHIVLDGHSPALEPKAISLMTKILNGIAHVRIFARADGAHRKISAKRPNLISR